jgi:tRNA A-37 threonylcarbamoyl transferase component Bud32
MPTMTQPHDPHDQPGLDGDRAPDEVAPLGPAASIVGILDRYLADLRAGQAPDREHLLANHPDLATELDACLAGIEFVHRATGPVAPETPATLGEFQIVREIGRGGMGVVYEAEQTPLRRRVALKVLRFGAVADKEAMHRFQREAETVARLHHTNIVPIFAIGCEGGVHYYAMQYIDGRSLADVLAVAQRAGQPASPPDILRWGLQAAEALAHAHQRGVIHRDIKPSNLLLDNEGAVWLTDFGLAKCADEVTLTVCGMLMGTPRYMSPEQAESVRWPIDHRTDIYSLGASLFELATGRPVFDATAPMGVLAQILTEEPARPRQICPDLPRDLETIILTCLAKDPAQRYQTAQALAEDLRAVLDGRPIRARRASAIGVAVRYVRKRKKALAAGAVVAAATVLLVAGALFGWRFYSDWRLGRVVLSTTGPALTAAVLPESGGGPIGEPFDIGAHTTLALPAGDYRLRVQGLGRLGQTYRFAVHRGETRNHELSLDRDRLAETPSISYPLAGDALALKPGKADFIEWTGDTLLRRDLAKGEVIWDAKRPETATPGPDAFAWMRRLALVPSNNHERPGTLVQPAVDLDGDGIGDLVMTFARTPSLLAVSGRNGARLWTYSAAVDGPGGPDPLGPDELAKALEEAAQPGGGTSEPAVKGGRVLGSPVLVQADGDGVPDLLALFFVFDDASRSPFVFGADGHVTLFDKSCAGRRVIAAVSGRTGRALWSRTLDLETLSRPWLWEQVDLRSPQPLFDPFDSEIVAVPDRKGSMVALASDSQWTELDPRTGQSRGQPIDFGFKPLQAPRYADLDGEGAPEVLALQEVKLQGTAFPILVAFSFTTGRRLWAETLWAYYQPVRKVPSAEWPLVADFDGDGRDEVVVPHIDSLPASFGPPLGGSNYQGFRMLDGRTGKTRWFRPFWERLRMGADTLPGLLAGPDLDGDGTRDLVTVTRDTGPRPKTYSLGHPLDREWVYVDAVSGRDGHLIWWWHEDVTNYATPQIGRALWWGLGPDGWPMLVVPLGGKTPGEFEPAYEKAGRMPPVVLILEASTGRLLQTIDGLSLPKLADLDGDGLEDLWGSAEGNLRAFRAGPPEAWRSLDKLVPAADLDGDGIVDATTVELDSPGEYEKGKLDSRTAVARSGRDGRALWTTTLDDRDGLRQWETWSGPRVGIHSTLRTFPLPGGDLDGDGAPEVVVTQRKLSATRPTIMSLPIEVLSGRSGRRLWSAGPLPSIGSGDPGYSIVEGIDVLASNPRQTADLVAVYQTPFPDGVLRPYSSLVQTRMRRLSGRDGRVVWDLVLGAHAALSRPWIRFDHANGDLDGDGSPDIVLRTWATTTPGTTTIALRAVSFRDGKTLWTHPLRDQKPAFAVGDLDGDGRAEVVVREQAPAVSEAAIELTALDGRDGATRWAWHGGTVPDPSGKTVPVYLADIDGTGRREVRFDFGTADGRRVMVLDAQGHERAGREPAGKRGAIAACADLDGDGRDELLVQDDARLFACRDGLAVFWSRPNRDPVEQVLPAHAGRPATVVLASMVALDGAKGHTLWKGRSGRAIETGPSAGRPRVLTVDQEATICTLVLPTTPEGGSEPAHGRPAPPGLDRNDPRWARPLPWSRPVAGLLPPQFFLLALGGLALINVVVPLWILKLATWRRVWSVRMLLALPVVVAIPMTAFLTFVSATSSMAGASAAQAIAGFAWATLGGLPIVCYGALVVSGLIRRDRRRLAKLAVLSVLATAVVAGFWFLVDGLTKPTIEYYAWSDWHAVIVPGLYLAGVLAMIAWAVRGARQFVRMRWRSRQAVPMRAS